MTAMLDRICQAMVEWFAGDAASIQHFLKVHAFAALIGRAQGLPASSQLVLEAAAYVHDIGVKPARERYGSAEGPYQEQLGPAPARALLTACGMAPADVERVAFLVGHHHTYTDIDGPDYQILVEADFLVNLHEGGADSQAVRSACEHIFRTPQGTALCRTMFGV